MQTQRVRPVRSGELDCCSGNCNQGRDCPEEPDQRRLGWLLMLLSATIVVCGIYWVFT